MINLEPCFKRVGQIINVLALSAFVTVGFLSCFYIFWRYDNSYPEIILFGLILVSSVISLLWASSRLDLASWFERLSKYQNYNLMLVCLLFLGLTLRLGWLYFVPPVQLSDAKSYIDAAIQLSETGHYSFIKDGYILKSWRPPGYPFVLTGFLYILGDHQWLAAVINISCYIATSLLVYQSASIILHRTSGLISVGILALWPNDITSVGLALGEPLSLLLFTLAFWSFLKFKNTGSLIYPIIAGVVTGYGALVKPALLVFPILWFLWFSMQRQRPVLRFAVMATIFSIMTIAPWTYRNYVVLDAFVPVSTNGGDVFYRANNPLATGGFAEQGAKDLSPYLHDELLWSATGFDWGLQWVRENPIDFAVLALKKQMIFLVGDNVGAYWGLKRAIIGSEQQYVLLSWISDIYWYLLWFVALAAIIKHRRIMASHPDAGFFLLSLLFFIVVHSVFESQSRHHIPMVGLLAIIAPALIWPTHKSPFSESLRKFADRNLERVKRIELSS